MAYEYNPLIQQPGMPDVTQGPATFTPPNQVGTAQFGGEGVNTGLQNALGNLSAYLQQNPMTPWQGPQVAGFTDAQLAGQQGMVNAATNMDTMAQQFGNLAGQGAQGDFALDPTLHQEAVQLAPELHQKADYLNPYQQNVINQAQQGAVGAVNEGFGAGGSLGSARNAQTASQAAMAASMPHLQKAYDTQFQADQAQNQANVGIQNQAQQYNVNNMNQLAQQNVGLQNQFAQQNLQNQQGFMGMLPTAMQLQTQPSNVLQQVGQQQQDMDQSQLNAAIQQYNVNQQMPMQNLYDQLGLAQTAQAAQAGTLTQDTSGGGSQGGLQGLLGGIGKFNQATGGGIDFMKMLGIG